MKELHKIFAIAMLAGLGLQPLSAQNATITVAQVTDGQVLSTATDLQITGTTPFATTGSVDIQNPDAAVIFTNIKPSLVIANYLSKITMGGVALKNNVNCRVSIYRHGSIVLPHSDTANPDGTEFFPLTTYSESNFGGESATYNGGDRRTSTTSFPFRSFKLKRGYMVTMANMPDGTGYSHCYIANSKDIEVNLRTELAGKVGFFRIFRWQWPAKKGVSDLNGEDRRSATNSSWFYTWGAGENARVDAEFVPQRHHENGFSNDGTQKWAWPSFGEINARDNTVTHVLGQNEPDNTGGGGEVNTYVSTIAYDLRGDGKGGTTTLMDVAANFLYSGMRIGTFANTNPSTSWVTDYVNRCREQNIRVDFVATHFYIGGQSPAGCISRLKALYDATGLPVWVTEWNNGANWTSESGFSTDSEGWYTWASKDTYNATDSRKNGVWLTDVLRRADSEKWLERLAVYHAVQACREIWRDGGLTEGGKLYAAYNSDFAYNEANEYFMTWNHKAPTDLSINFYTTSRRAILSWSNNNGKQTDSVYVERKVGTDGTWTVIAKLGTPTATTMSYNYDDLNGVKGLISYRIHNIDSDNRHRYSGEASVSLPEASGNSTIQFGNITIPNVAEAVTVDFGIPFETENPLVFTGIMSGNNANTITSPLFKVGNITKTQFSYIGKIWENQPGATTTYTEPETLPFMAIKPGNYTYGETAIEVGSVSVKDTIDVTFQTPFPEGVTPIVIGTVNRTLYTKSPTIHKIWNITNTGFRAAINFEQSLGSNPTLNSTLAYMAITPGTACIDEAAGLYLSAGRSSTPLHTTARPAYFTRTSTTAGGEVTTDTILTEDPIVFGDVQTSKTPVPVTLRKSIDITKTYKDADGVSHKYTTGLRLKRVVDKSATTVGVDGTSTADTLGWVAIHQTLSYDPVGISSPIVSKASEEPLQVKVINRIVYVEGVSSFDLYTIDGMRAASNATQVPGIYIVRSKGKVAKIMIE